MKLQILKSFSFAHDGIRVEHYVADTEVETEDPELVKVATKEKWAKLVKGDPAENKSLGNSPENKDAAGETTTA